MRSEGKQAVNNRRDFFHFDEGPLLAQDWLKETQSDIPHESTFVDLLEKAQDDLRNGNITIWIIVSLKARK